MMPRPFSRGEAVVVVGADLRLVASMMPRPFSRGELVRTWDWNRYDPMLQ